MEHEEKLRRWIVYADNNKIGRGYQRPPMDMLFQKLGVKTAPIVFWPFYRAAIVMGLYFAIVWGVLMYIVVWRSQELTLEHMLTMAGLAGLGFGILMALNYWRVKRKYKLPAWQDFSPR